MYRWTARSRRRDQYHADPIRLRRCDSSACVRSCRSTHRAIAYDRQASRLAALNQDQQTSGLPFPFAHRRSSDRSFERLKPSSSRSRRSSEIERRSCQDRSPPPIHPEEGLLRPARATGPHRRTRRRPARAPARARRRPPAPAAGRPHDHRPDRPKVWSFCTTLRDDGVGYGDYLEQLTYLIFLKMADEYARPPYNRDVGIPAEYHWAEPAQPERARSWRCTTSRLLRELGTRRACSARFSPRRRTRSRTRPSSPA